jgi:ABC-type sulfate/molybdate transport systems ATPase subunit
MVTQPKVLLLDEPFVSLNEELRATMRRLIQSVGVTTLLVTHDVRESESVAARTINL